MPYLEWSSDLAIGHAEIDAQHQELVRRIDSLLVAMAAGKHGEVLRLFEFLGSYVLAHFATEERLMQQGSDPAFAAHKAEHEAFAREFEAVRRAHAISGATAAVTLKVKAWVADWFNRHIRDVDRRLADHLLGEAGRPERRRVGAGPAESP